MSDPGAEGPEGSEGANSASAEDVDGAKRAEESPAAELLPVELIAAGQDDGGLRVNRETLRGMSGSLKKAMAAGLRTVLTGDERWKESLPGDLAAYVARQSEVVKAEILKAVGRQTRLFLKELDLQKELRELLSDMRVEITTQVRILPREDGGTGTGPEVVVRSGDHEQSIEQSALAPLVETLARSLAQEWTAPGASADTDADGEEKDDNSQEQDDAGTHADE